MMGIKTTVTENNDEEEEEEEMSTKNTDKEDVFHYHTHKVHVLVIFSVPSLVKWWAVDGFYCAGSG